MISYPITHEVHDAKHRFSEIRDRVCIPSSGRSKLEIVRVLGNTPYEHLDQLLILLNKHLPRSGDIGKRVLQQTDPLQFKQALREFFLFVHLQNVPEAQAWAASARSASKCYDIDLTIGELSACIEVYCPVDFFGFQLMKQLIPSIFRYLNINMGFEIDLRLETLKDMDWFYPYEVGYERTVRPWLVCLQSKAEEWVRTANAGDQWQFPGPTERVRFSAKLQEVYDDPQDRCIRFLPSTRSTDSKLFFEVGSPKDTAKSEWGRKLLEKLKKRQCGDPDLNCLRILALDFSLADTGWLDFICQPKIAKRLSQTVELLVSEIGPPLPYDAVLPARLSGKCCFGKVIGLDRRRTEEIEEIVTAALLDRPCVFPHIDQTQHIHAMLGEVREQKAR